MPLALERKLKSTAHKRGYSKERTGRYVYGTMKKVERKMSHKDMLDGMKKRMGAKS